MNFIGRLEGSEMRVELKYCERCGGLFLRPPAENRVYCALCTLHFVQRPDPEEMLRAASLRKVRRRRTHGAESGVETLRNTGRIGTLQAVSRPEVWA